MTHFGDKETEIISSIASPSIRKVTLVTLIYRYLSWNDVNWGVCNEPLCRLAGRLGPTAELEVEIRIVNLGGVSMQESIHLGEIVSSLTAFREKGRIRLVYVDQDKRAHVVYSLDSCSPNPPASVC